MNRREATPADSRDFRVVAVNQPYIFPYLGYFQLIHAADVFVVYDDVQWIRGGWINRNRILMAGNPKYFTLPVSKPSVHRKIRDHQFAAEFERQRPKMIKRLEAAYDRAPFFHEVMPLIEKCLRSAERNVSSFAVYALHAWCEYLGITTKIVLSSELAIDPLLKGQERVLAINVLFGAKRYVNLIGGKEVYRNHDFAEQGIELRFVQTRPLSYVQLGHFPFVSGLSIIDVAMHNSPADARRLLEEYDLVGGS